MGCEGHLISALWRLKVQMMAKVELAIQALAWSFPRDLCWALAEAIRYEARGGENLASKTDNAEHRG